MLKSKKTGLLSTDLSTAVYLLLTAILIIVFHNNLPHTSAHLLFRLGIILFMFLLVWLQQKKDSKWLKFIQLFYPIVLLSYTFGETAYINHLFFQQSLDPIFFGWEQGIFRFQPSIEFSKHFPERWFSELMNFSYFSFYFMTMGVALAFYVKYPKEAEKTIFLIITSLFIYYTLFILIPVEGPQYYLPAPLNQPLHSGMFSNWVQFVERYGDKPTGAFPSSHVGMAIIYLLITYRKLPKLFSLLFPFALLICLATVYVKAHYALDVIGGLVSAPLIYLLSKWMYKNANKLIRQ